MSVKIETIDSDNIDVNGIRVYKDHNENWVATAELTVQEKDAFNRHLNSIKRANEAKD